ncbi:hypothetical protein Misp01_82120 [Microtetraspora sp. NBRC 13810]|nr:hypothetical protein Misp01_82120 [Microtetraspora sp. NBRC 13810]
MSNDDLDLFHAGHYREMIIDVATGLSRATARLHEVDVPGLRRADDQITALRNAGLVLDERLSSLKTRMTFPGKTE